MKIQQIGERERFVVVNNDGCYWSGPCPGWVPELRSARVFAHREEAENVVRILDQQEKKRPQDCAFCSVNGRGDAGVRDLSRILVAL